MNNLDEKEKMRNTYYKVILNEYQLRLIQNYLEDYVKLLLDGDTNRLSNELAARHIESKDHKGHADLRKAIQFYMDKAIKIADIDTSMYHSKDAIVLDIITTIENALFQQKMIEKSNRKAKLLGTEPKIELYKI